MSAAEGIASIVLTCMSVGLACLLVFRCWRGYRLDLLRHRLFVLRDELFNAVLDGPLEFSDHAYIMQRHSINSMLRFAHKINFARMLLYLFVGRGPNFDEALESHQRELNEALHMLDSDEARRCVEGIRRRFLLEVIKHTAIGWVVLTTSRIAANVLKSPPRDDKALLRRARILEMEASQAGDSNGNSNLRLAAA